MNGLPKVSIVCITYEHVKFVKNCLDGFLEQKVGFEYEIIVHDDASTDGTVDIIREYASAHPSRIVTILQTENQRSKGIRPWPPCFAKARGEYIALCEGDDHWIDVDKLQRQVDALDADPMATGCFTNAYNELRGERVHFLGGYTKVPRSMILREADYLQGQGIPTCTFMFRRSAIAEYPTVLRSFSTGDTALFTLLLGKGHFIYQPNFTAVRVMHAGGVYSLQGTLHQLNVQLKNLPAQDQLTQGRYSDVIQKRKLAWLEKAWSEGLHHQNWPLAQLAWQHLRKERTHMGWSLWRTWFNGMLVYYPGIVKRMVQLKHGLRSLVGGAMKN